MVQKKAKAQGETPGLRLLRSRHAGERNHGRAKHGPKAGSVRGAPKHGGSPGTMRRGAAVEGDKEVRGGGIAQNDVR